MEQSPIRVGILTFHAGPNYGAVLQTFALQTTIEEMGYQVCVMDRWVDAGNSAVRGPFKRGMVRGLAVFICCFLAGCAKLSEARRRLRTYRFLHQEIHLTPYHFLSWKDLQRKDLGIDGIVVGSDQVWRCWDSVGPELFLLEDAPDNLRAISYAASLGMTSISPEWVSTFQRGLARFSAISVRETSAVEVLKTIGTTTTAVLDPTLLIPKERWRAWQPTKRKARRPKLVCYFFFEDWPKLYTILIRFAKRMGCDVELFSVESPCNFPTSWSRAVNIFKFWLWRHRPSPVHFHISGGPKELVNAIADATWVVTVSFHGLMFSTIFERNVRIVTAPDSEQSPPFTRIKCFADRYIKGPLFARGVEAALESLARGEHVTYDKVALEQDRQRSLQWLRNALAPFRQRNERFLFILFVGGGGGRSINQTPRGPRPTTPPQ